MDFPRAPSLKVMCIGDAAVGKTYFLRSLTSDDLPGEYIPTESIAPYTTTPTLTDDESVTLELYDTPPSDSTSCDRHALYPHVNTMFLCFAVTSPSSLQSVNARWALEVRRFAAHVPFVLVGMKADMREKREIVEGLRELGMSPVSAEEGQRAAREIGAVDYVDCSAMDAVSLRREVIDTLRSLVTRGLIAADGGA